MIALVSGQRMQNIIPCFQRGLEFAEVHLVRSREADIPGSSLAWAWRDTKNVLASKIRVQDVDPAIDAYDIRAAGKAVGEVLARLRSRGLEPVVNFTGGTKCMAVGAYLAAVEAGCTALYVDTNNERLLWYESAGRMREETFALDRLTADIYLQAYGWQVSDRGKPELVRRCQGIVQLISENWPACVPVFDEWAKSFELSRICNQKAKHAYVELPGTVAPALSARLAQLALGAGLLEKRSGALVPTDDGCQIFKQGRWLELFVLHILQQRLRSPETLNEIWWDVKIDRLQENLPAAPEQAGLHNELDVIFMRRGQLYVIECKSGPLRKDGYLNKLQAMLKLLGGFARIYFATSQPGDKVSETFREWARTYEVKGIYAQENLSEIGRLAVPADG